MNKNKPNLTLNMDDKIYLAVAKHDLDKLSFVYTLACLKADKKTNMYNMLATHEIHTFKDKQGANLFYETIQQMIDFNVNDKGREQFASLNDELVKRFYDNVGNER